MSRPLSAVIISIGLHVSIIILIIAAGRAEKHLGPPIVIDFRLVEPQNAIKKGNSSKKIAYSTSPIIKEEIAQDAPLPHAVSSPEGSPVKSEQALVSPAMEIEAKAGEVPGADDGNPEENAVAAGQAYVAVQYGHIRDSINNKKEYPRVARMRDIEGRVVVAFKINKDGKAAEVRVMESSGAGILDESAMKAVRLASPFPPPGVEADVIVPVVYKLQ